jgi:aldehyde dehydrogenase (NAD+)
MEKLRVGNPLDKSIDVGALVDPVQVRRVTEMVASNHSGDVFSPSQIPQDGCFYPPTLITGLSPADSLMQEEIFGPVLVSTTFRTPDEAVAIANNTRYGLAATIWSENINLALDIAPKLVAGVVWINSANMLDAAAGFGGVRESGFGREGGWEGLSAYTKPKTPQKPLKAVVAMTGKRGPAEGIDRTAKLYIGGKQARPDGGQSAPVWGKAGDMLGHKSIAGRKDVRNAVEAAHAAKSWSTTTGHLRAQILYYIAENLAARATEFAGRLDEMQGGKSGTKEVKATIQRLFTYAAWADKYDGQIHNVPLRAAALAMKEPVGVIGAICLDEAPLLGLISCMAPAIAMGNRVVLAASSAFPLSATDFVQVLETSDVPAGVVNILTGPHLDIAEPLARHMDVSGLWCFGAAPLSQMVEQASAQNLKRTWVNNGMARDWHSREGEGVSFLQASTEIKNIWIPYGE